MSRVSDEKLDVSIVMPCLNEAATVVECVEHAKVALATLNQRHGWSGEVIVADNGSDDGSQDLARGAGARVVNVPMRGYGAALREGFRQAKGRFLVMGDSDCSYDFAESVALVEALEAGADLCMGSRFKGEIKPGAMPWKNRYIGNPVLSFILRLLFSTKVSDSHCGLRALTREAFDRLRLNSPGMEFASEMVLKASSLGMAIDERPVTLSPDKRGRPPHLRPWRDGWRHLRYMLMLSPIWLFLGPGLLAFGIGVLILSALLLQPADETVDLFGLAFGDHWLFLSSALIVSGTQTAVMGLVAVVHSVRQGWRRPPGWLRRLIPHLRLEYWMVLGLAMIVLAVVGILSAYFGWARSGFGQLDAFRPIALYATMLILGFQCFFGGFLLSVVGGARAETELTGD